MDHSTSIDMSMASDTPPGTVRRRHAIAATMAAIAPEQMRTMAYGAISTVLPLTSGQYVFGSSRAAAPVSTPGSVK